MSAPFQTADAPAPSEPPGLARAAKLVLCIAICWIPALVGAGAVGEASALYPLADSPDPYFVPGHALLLYLWSPLVVASSCILLLSPGLFLSIALNAARSVALWITSAFAVSLVVVSVASQVVQAVMGKPLLGTAFALVVAACSLVCAALMLLRAKRPIAWPLAEPHAASTLTSMAVIPLVLLIALTPKFYWENINGDGAAAFESARLLLLHPLPFWPHTAGSIADYPGMKNLVSLYPPAWFMRLFGLVEASARLPYLLGLVGLYAGLLGIIQYGREQAVGLAERWLLWVGLFVFSVVMAFSSTYEPYVADIALPAMADILEMALLCGFILMFLQGKLGWMALLLVLAYGGYPHCVPVAGLWLLASAALIRPLPVRALVVTALVLVGLVGFDAVAPALFQALHLTPPGVEHGNASLVERILHPQWRQLRRIGWVVVPAGILPALAIGAWRWQDRVARCLTVVTVGEFLFFYFQWRVALHYFIPAMVLPLAVFWRMDILFTTRLRNLALGATAAGGLLALVLSWPSSLKPMTTTRLVGSSIEDRIGGYDRSDAKALARTELLHRLFPRMYEQRVPDRAYGGSPLAWYFYANRPRGAQKVNYVMQTATDVAPAGASLVASEDGVSLYVLDQKVWAEHLALRPPLSAANPVYLVPKFTLFAKH